MDNTVVETCVVDAFRRWHFPRPLGGGKVIVSYPVTLTPNKSFPVAGTTGKKDRAAEISVLNHRTMVHTTTGGGRTPANGLIIVTDDGLLLIDTGWNDTQTDAILDWGERRLKRRWVGAVITHDHGDRVGGLSALVRRKIPIAALDLTVASLERRGMQGVTTLFKVQDRAFDDPRGFEAFYPGPGHAPDNIVVRFRSVLFGGCLLKATNAPDLGNLGSANLAAWPQSVHAVIERYPDREKVSTIVPGHGPVDNDGSSLRHTLDLLAAEKAEPAEPAVAALLGPETPAPDFTTVAHNGQTVTLSKLRGKQVVLYFYPKDDTTGCTKEACEFRDRWGELQKAGVMVFGVSTQDNASHTAFAQKYGLPFPLLPDEKGELAAKYFVPVMNGKAQRITYLIGKDGRVQHVWPRVDPVGHAQDILTHVGAR